MSQQTTISALAQQACQGNELAKSQLREKLEAGLIVIVKRTLKSGVTRNILSRKIMEEFRRIANANVLEGTSLPIHIATEIARRICDLLMSRLDSKIMANPLLETVAGVA
ncbi:MAG: hypothetical protein ACFCD0_00760 [Gemmataceae bacterium]